MIIFLLTYGICSAKENPDVKSVCGGKITRVAMNGLCITLYVRPKLTCVERPGENFIENLF